jgi:hypothetical protein
MDGSGCRPVRHVADGELIGGFGEPQVGFVELDFELYCDQ